MFRSCLRCGVIFNISKRSKSSGKGPPEFVFPKSFAQKGHKKPPIRKPVVLVKRVVKPRPEVTAARLHEFSSRNRNDKKEEAIFQPVEVQPPKKEADQDDIGEEIAGKLDKVSVSEILKQFTQSPTIKSLATQYGIEGDIFINSMQSFRRYCIHADFLPVDLHIILSDVVAGAGHSDDLFPYFLQHAKQVYPHLNCLEDLKNISDISDPANWYPLARQLKRKFIFHAGPTNSGKTYHALKKFMNSKRGIYCGPLRLLAMEVFDKCNEYGTPCDLITGETRKYVRDEPSDHVACTVEMVNTAQQYETAVIDEIQMIADPQRGWAWTRAILGVAAEEVHVCGEERAVDLIRDLITGIGDDFEVRRYQRLTKLTYLKHSVDGFDNIKPGDCIVCFTKGDIFKVSRKLTSLGHNCAVIYGALPPGTKIMQSKRFNDPEDPCNVLVATDAIGMGLNLAIKRIIFYSILKKSMNEEGNYEIDYLTPSQAKQIGGRAGRYRTQYEDGEVTTYRAEHLTMLRDIVEEKEEPIKKAGINPTLEQIEMFAYHLPNATLSNLLDIFNHVCQMDQNNYFLCSFQDFKELAEIIEHLPLPMKVKYTFCSAPIRLQNIFAKAIYLKMARRFANGEAITFEWMYKELGGPFAVPKNVNQLDRLEGAFFVIDIYLWLSYRYPDMFYDMDAVRALRIEVDNVIQKYMRNTAFIDTTENTKKSTDKRKLSKAALQQIEKVFGSSNPMSKYDPPPKYVDLVSEDSEQESDSDGVDMEQLKQISSKISKEIETEVIDSNPIAKYDPPPHAPGSTQKQTQYDSWVPTNETVCEKLQSYPKLHDEDIKKGKGVNAVRLDSTEFSKTFHIQSENGKNDPNSR